MRARALEDTDRIVGRLLDHVEPGDLVMVVGPTPPQERDALSVAAVRGPGFSPVCCAPPPRNATASSNLTDVAPTVLTYFGLDRPTRWRVGAWRPATPGARSPSARSHW